MSVKHHAALAISGTQAERRAYDTNGLPAGTIWIETSGTYEGFTVTDTPQVYVWTGPSGEWMRLAATDLVRFGEITENDEDVAGYGIKVFFSGGPSFSGGGSWDSENSDELWIARYNAASDYTEWHFNIGDNPGFSDRIEIGYTLTGVWYPVLYIGSDGTVVFTKNAEPADGDLVNSSFTFWLDDTPAATILKIKAKDSAGTVVTADVALA